jgi:TetR/AcrR family transcriptional regulator
MADQELRLRILQQASVQFVKHGFAKVTTGEIAAGAGISKKTLYKYFRSKEELFRAVGLMHLNEIKEKFGAISGDRKRTLSDKLYDSMQVLAGKLREIGDFLKDEPGPSRRVYDDLLAQRRDIIVGFYRRLFREGRKSGAINRRINETAFIVILVTLIQSLFVPDVLSGLPLSNIELFSSVVYTLLEGVLSERERQHLAARPLVFESKAGGYWNA